MAQLNTGAGGHVASRPHFSFVEAPCRGERYKNRRIDQRWVRAREPEQKKRVWWKPSEDGMGLVVYTRMGGSVVETYRSFASLDEDVKTFEASVRGMVRHLEAIIIKHEQNLGLTSGGAA